MKRSKSRIPRCHFSVEVPERLSQDTSGHLCSPCASGAALSEFKEGIKVGSRPLSPLPCPTTLPEELGASICCPGEHTCHHPAHGDQPPSWSFFDKRGDEWNLKDHPCHGVSPASNFTGLQSSVLASHCKYQSQEILRQIVCFLFLCIIF